ECPSSPHHNGPPQLKGGKDYWIYFSVVLISSLIDCSLCTRIALLCYELQSLASFLTQLDQLTTAYNNLHKFQKVANKFSSCCQSIKALTYIPPTWPVTQGGPACRGGG